jgi:hypothetical protein
LANQMPILRQPKPLITSKYPNTMLSVVTPLIFVIAAFTGNLMSMFVASAQAIMIR